MANKLGLKNGIKKSNELYERAKKVIASGTNTFSRAPGVFPDGVSPKFLCRQYGSHVWDVDDNVYIDLKCNYKNIIQIQDFDNFILKHNLNLEKIKLLTSLIWINMSPLHDKEFGIFLYFFGLYNINICYK